MPVYDYRCDQCETDFIELRPMSRYADPAPCPRCGAQAPRVIGAPRLNTMRAHLRLAYQTNERSAHQPKVTQGHQCGPQCSHQGPGTSPLRQASGPKRPWMLGH
ncbi:MAG: FmdB family zinc ribbon protein [Gammaproteobacteria bacterium]